MKMQKGFSLIEALIALLIIAIGLLGIAGLQAASVYRSHVGGMNSLAAVEAQSIAAAMIANPGAFPANGTAADYNTLDAATVSYTTDCSTAVCSSPDMALYDLYQWGTELANDLPQGKGKVQCYASPPQCTVTVNWSQKQMAASAGTSLGTISTQRYQLVVHP
ncbi:MAG: type IV pilus modification protein PilV [Gammaproteobacteria bacterium]